jgi:uncharacterized membrane protein YdbT with pleckstrin-like domain
LCKCSSASPPHVELKEQIEKAEERERLQKEKEEKERKEAEEKATGEKSAIQREANEGLRRKLTTKTKMWKVLMMKSVFWMILLHIRSD